ncbi:hypothetical protein ACHAXM_002167 [Skeletonema potamos]|jgi:hypothetical protein
MENATIINEGEGFTALGTKIVTPPFCLSSGRVRSNVRGTLGAAFILGYGGSLRMAFAFLSEVAHNLQEANPKLGRETAYLMAIKNFITEPVAN